MLPRVDVVVAAERIAGRASSGRVRRCEVVGPWCGALNALRPRLLALAFHRALEALAIERSPGSRGHVLDEVERQPVGVVERNATSPTSDDPAAARASSTSSSRGRPSVSTASNRSSSRCGSPARSRRGPRSSG